MSRTSSAAWIFSKVTFFECYSGMSKCVPRVEKKKQLHCWLNSSGICRFMCIVHVCTTCVNVAVVCCIFPGVPLCVHLPVHLCGTQRVHLIDIRHLRDLTRELSSNTSAIQSIVLSPTSPPLLTSFRSTGQSDRRVC